MGFALRVLFAYLSELFHFLGALFEFIGNLVERSGNPHVSWEFAVLIGVLAFYRQGGKILLLFTTAFILWDLFGQDGRGLALDFFTRSAKIQLPQLHAGFDFFG